MWLPVAILKYGPAHPSRGARTDLRASLNSYRRKESLASMPSSDHRNAIPMRPTCHYHFDRTSATGWVLLPKHPEWFGCSRKRTGKQECKRLRKRGGEPAGTIQTSGTTKIIIGQHQQSLSLTTESIVAVCTTATSCRTCSRPRGCEHSKNKDAQYHSSSLLAQDAGMARR